MPADFHQSRRHRAHGAVVGRKRLIELSHPAADGGLGLYKINLDACVRQVQRGLHPPDATAHHLRGAHNGVPILGIHAVFSSRVISASKALSFTAVK